MSNVLAFLAEASKRHILNELRDGPKTVAEICAATGLKQPNVSSHLARLKENGLVEGRRQGRHVFYSLGGPDVIQTIRTLDEVQQNLDDEGVDLAEESLRFAQAGVRGNEREAMEIVDRLSRLRLCHLEFFEEVLAPAMNRIGVWYESKAIDVAQEHMASEITKRAMARFSSSWGPPRKKTGTAVLGCAPGNWHTIGLRMVADYLQFLGWEVRFLGANVPECAFTHAVQEVSADLVLISLLTSESVEPTNGLFSRLIRQRGKSGLPLLLAGGPVAHQNPDILREAGADFVFGDLRAFALALPDIEVRVKNESSRSA